MRLMLVCAMAARLPIQRQHRQHDQHLLPIDCQPDHASTSGRTAIANAASLGAAANQKRVTAVGAPWYTSGTHMWKGGTELEGQAGDHEHHAEHQHRGVGRRQQSAKTGGSPASRWRRTSSTGHRGKPLARAPSTKYFIAASVETA